MERTRQARAQPGQTGAVVRTMQRRAGSWQVAGAALRLGTAPRSGEAAALQRDTDTRASWHLQRDQTTRPIQRRPPRAECRRRDQTRAPPPRNPPHSSLCRNSPLQELCVPVAGSLPDSPRRSGVITRDGFRTESHRTPERRLMVRASGGGGGPKTPLRHTRLGGPKIPALKC